MKGILYRKPQQLISSCCRSFLTSFSRSLPLMEVFFIERAQVLSGRKYAEAYLMIITSLLSEVSLPNYVYPQ